MRSLLTRAAGIAIAAGLPLLAAGDEIDDLARQLSVRPHFHGYKARFHYDQRTFTFPGPKGETQQLLRLVMDGDKYVALIADDHIELLAFSPLLARTTLALRTGRYHLDNLRGPLLPTGAFLTSARRRGYPADRPGPPPTDHFRGGGTQLTLVRASSDRSRKVLHKYDFLVHPMFGYLVEGTTEVTFTQPPAEDKRQTTTTVFCPNSYVPWPTRWTYDRTVFCPGGATGYLGYANNPIAIDRADRNAERFTWRSGGFIAFLEPKTGWSVCRTRSDGGPPARMTLDAHNQFHVTVPFLDELPKDKAERETYTTVQRLFAVPPEITGHLRQNMKLLDVGAEAAICRVGEAEDFESQPVALGEPIRGLAWTSNAPKVTQEAAHGGKKALLLRGQWQPNEPVLLFRSDTPPVPLRPGAKYLLEAWLKVENMTTIERLTYRAQYDATVARLREENARLPADRRKDIPGYRGPKPNAEAYLTADLYEADPNGSACVARQKTEPATAKMPGWQKVSLEFTTPEWDPYVEIAFVVDSGQAFLDDFSFRRID